ncbi:MAG: efflux RND transporter periplasmic adaptor subunit [Deltaproteobacteria bacterium]|nr:efflux RND transporter periplasmic adaptor subunit [Deltaproteobacteria bacterium]
MALGEKARRPVIIILLVIALILFWRLLLSNRKETASFIRATGVIEATEVNIASKVAGRTEWLCCTEGSIVKAGQKAVALEKTELKARLQEGKAELLGASESINEAKVSLENSFAASEAAKYETEAAAAEVRRVSALLQDTKDNLDRARGLFKGSYITKKEMDSAETSYGAAAAALDAAVARKKSSEANLKNSLLSIKAAKARISLAAAKKEQAAARLKVLGSQLSDTVIVSPIDGVVVYKAFELGEFVTPGAAVYTVDDMNNLWARFDLEETDIEKIRLGDRVEVYPIGSPGKAFDGKVTEISEAGGFATQRDVTRGRSDIRTFSVKARINRPEGFLKPRMTVEVKVFFANAPKSK